MIALVDGRRVGYDDVGDGMPVVFLHGFPHDRTLWAAQLGSLAVPVRTLACDLRGFGESDMEGDASAMTIDDYARDVAAWLRGLSIDRAVIAGVSMGGYIAFALWRRDPSLVRALVLADTRAGNDDETGRARRTAHIEFVRQRGSAEFAEELLPSMLGKTTRAANPELMDGVRTMLARAPVNAVIGALTAMRDRPDSTPALATIGVPTLIVVGAEDAITPVKESRAMHGAIAGSRLEIVPGAGHLASAERPAAFNHVLSEFLAALAYT